MSSLRSSSMRFESLRFEERKVFMKIRKIISFYTSILGHRG